MVFNSLQKKNHSSSNSTKMSSLKSIDEELADAAKEGDISELYRILHKDPHLLEQIDQKSFIDTPLHIASMASSPDAIYFALEVMNLKPSFGFKLNADGASPLHLALMNNHSEMVKRLVKFEPRLVRVKGRGLITPLHYLVGVMDNVDLLAEFILASPGSIEEVTGRGDSVVHIAIKNGKIEAFKVLLGWLQRTRKEEVLNWKDDEGNTVLHVAVAKAQIEVIQLLENTKVEVNARNTEGNTALDLWQTNDKIKNILQRQGAFPALSLPKSVTIAEFLSSPPYFHRETMVGLDIFLDRGLSGDIRNALLVVAVLIATATYQTLLQPPGGFTISNTTRFPKKLWFIPLNSSVNLVMSKFYFYPFIIMNTIAFAASVAIILLLLPSSRYNTLLHATLFCLMMSYMWSLFAISPPSAVTKYLLQLSFAPFFIIISAWIFKLEKRIRSTFEGCNLSQNRIVAFVYRIRISRTFLKRYLSRLANEDRNGHNK